MSLSDFFKKKESQSQPPPQQKSSQPVQVSVGSCLSEKTILITEAPEKKSAILRSLVEKISADDPSVPLEKTFQSVMEREKVTSTFMETGIAIPHARMSALTRIHGALAIVPEGFSLPKKPLKVHFIFLFISPENNLSAHLQLLSKVSWVFQNQALKSKLIQSKNPSDILSLIQKFERETPHGSN